MAIRGLQKLPILIKNEEALLIYKQLSRVNKLLGQLNESFKNSIINESFLGLLSYNESVQSTRIEGTQVTFHEIMEISGKNTENVTWQQNEVLNYQKAMEHGLEVIKSNGVISTRLIKELHSILMVNARGTSSNGGEFRKVPNFIGPDDKIENASYIPINANEIGEYMSNLEYFINGKKYTNDFVENIQGFEYINYKSDALLRLAVAHAQFESIHPFLDGNGRLGRILISLMAVQEGVVNNTTFFVSEELEKERIRYYNSLNATRGENPDWKTWIMYFLSSSERMAQSLLKKITDAEELMNYGLNKCKTETQRKVWMMTFLRPVSTASNISKITHQHASTIKKALDFLVGMGLLDKDNSVKRNVKYYNYELMRTIDK